MLCCSWRPAALFLVAGLPLLAQPPSAHQLRADIAALSALRALALTQAQAEAILTAARQIAEETARVADAEATFFRETHESLVAIEWAMIRNEPLPDGAQEDVERQRGRYLRVLDNSERAITRHLAAIDAALTNDQRAIIEPAEVAALRQAVEAEARRRRAAALRQATMDLTSWVPETDTDSFTAGLDARLDSVLAIGYANAQPAQLTAVRGNLATLYREVRGMTPAQRDNFGDEVGPRLRAILPGALPTETSVRYALTRDEWVGLWRGADGSRLLVGLLRALPRGDR